MDPYEIIKLALIEAIAVMKSMIVNEGQASVLADTFIPKFITNAQADPENGWNSVDPQPYQSFMSETIDAGNQIMLEAYIKAKTITLIKRLF